MIEVYQIPPEQFDEYWPHIEGYMERAAKYTYGRYKVEDIRNTLNEGGCELWAALRPDRTVTGAVITAITVHPQMKTLTMVFCGGVDRDSWKEPMVSAMQKYARDNGCTKLEATARKGWFGVFKNDGYVERAVMFEMPV